MRLFMLAVALCLFLQAPPAAASRIKDDENIVFFTTAAKQEGVEWVVPVHAWVFEPEDNSLMRRAALAALVEAFELDESALGSAVFLQRAKWFLVDNESGKSVGTTVNAQVFGPTGANGHAEGELRLQKDGATSLSYTAVLPSGDNRVFKGEAVLVAPEGLSVISDIDDTIKISEVTDKKKLMENTFLKPFEESPGMVGAYKKLSAAGAVFHYVSSSPWQLYPALDEFMRRVEFPVGSIHLRQFRIKDETVWNMMKSSTETKPPVINKLLADYPQRTFIFIGDSGEKDPEIYGKIARENPGRVKHIYIRDVTGDKPESERYKTAFSDLAPFTWTIFTDASVIKAE